jgi:hypothetical protein
MTFKTPNRINPLKIHSLIRNEKNPYKRYYLPLNLKLKNKNGAI